MEQAGGTFEPMQTSSGPERSTVPPAHRHAGGLSSFHRGFSEKLRWQHSLPPSVQSATTRQQGTLIGAKDEMVRRIAALQAEREALKRHASDGPADVHAARRLEEVRDQLRRLQIELAALASEHTGAVLW
jgi:hypothetical protein